MLATLVIFLREGVEASMIVAILLAYLNRSGQRRHFRDVFAGVAVALALAAAGGIVAYLTIKTYAGTRVQTIFETATFLLATVLLTYMTFWMRSHARGLKSELQSRADAVLAGHGEQAADPAPAPSKAAVTVPAGAGSVSPPDAVLTGGAAPAAGSEPMSRGARAGLALLAFQAVGREGLETVVFTLAIAFSSTQKGGLLAGGAIGLAIALVIAFVMYKLGHRINIGRFFTIVGALLMVFAAGLLVDAVQNLQELGWLPGGSHQLWHTGSILSEDSALGDIAHSFLGYAQSPTVLQAVVYLAYLACVLFAFFGLRQRLSRRAATH
ncbi:MAG: FTR1 family iron permease [Streptosporangiaceae bacterium]